MEGYLAQIGLVVLLVVINAALAGTEIALVTLRAGQIARLEGGGPGGRAVARLARDPNRFLATIQIGITLSGFLASATAAVTLAQPLVEPLGFLGEAAGPVAVVLVTVVLTFFTLVFGELAPKRIAMQRSEAWAVLAARPLDLLGTLSRPAVWLLGISTDLVVRVLGGDPGARGSDEASEEELREMVSGHRGMTPTQRTIINGALELSSGGSGTSWCRAGRSTRSPRRRPPGRRRASSPSAAIAAPRWSRATNWTTWWAWCTGATCCSTTTSGGGGPAADAAPRHPGGARRVPADDRRAPAAGGGHRGDRRGGRHRQPGGLLEEIVGEIYDETDSDVRGATRLEDGSIRLPGTFPVHDLADVGVHRRTCRTAPTSRSPD